MMKWTEYSRLTAYENLWILCAIWIYKTHKRYGDNANFEFSKDDIENLARFFGVDTPPSPYFTQTCAINADRNQGRNYIIIRDRNKFMLAYDGYGELENTTLEEPDAFWDDFYFECDGEQISMRDLKYFINYKYKDIVKDALEAEAERPAAPQVSSVEARLEKIENSIAEIRALLEQLAQKI